MMSIEWRDLEASRPSAGDLVWIFHSGDAVRIGFYHDSGAWTSVDSTICGEVQFVHRTPPDAWAEIQWPRLPVKVWKDPDG